MTRENEGNERRYRHRLNSEWPSAAEQPRKEAKYKVHLACGHTLWFPFPLPRPGETLWCATCDSPMRVVPQHTCTPPEAAQ